MQTEQWLVKLLKKTLSNYNYTEFNIYLSETKRIRENKYIKNIEYLKYDLMHIR